MGLAELNRLDSARCSSQSSSLSYSSESDEIALIINRWQHFSLLHGAPCDSSMNLWNPKIERWISGDGWNPQPTWWPISWIIARWFQDSTPNSILYGILLPLQMIHLDQKPPGGSTTNYYRGCLWFFKIQMKPWRVMEHRNMKLHGFWRGFFWSQNLVWKPEVSGTSQDFFEERELYRKAKSLRWVKRFQVKRGSWTVEPFKICQGTRLGAINNCRLILTNFVNWNASNRSKLTSVINTLWCWVYQIELSFVKPQFHVWATASSTHSHYQLVWI